MKTYLVGGAVRDKLLGLSVTERDWVVVGAEPAQLLQQGYKQVGRDFPVFLHPKTKEEYALARTERKINPGYHGFSCDFNAYVTIEEDLARRDLTINAMAIDDDGHILDPFHGRDDLDSRVLRHVSDAFVEDPVRVLRIARFAARFYHLGFRVADETRNLMYSMVQKRELTHLVAERVWQEWRKSLDEKNPELFITTLRSSGALRVILPEIDVLFGVPCARSKHEEVDSGVHTLMVLQAAAAMSYDPMIRFAACVHDLGKAMTSIQNWPRQDGHDELGLSPIETLCHRLRVPVSYRKLALMVSRFHLNIHRVYDLSSEQIVTILEQTDAFRRPELFESLLTVCEADSLGSGVNRGGYPQLPWFFPEPLSQAVHSYPQKNYWLELLQGCNNVQVSALVSEGYTGDAIKAALHQQRVSLVNEMRMQNET